MIAMRALLLPLLLLSAACNPEHRTLQHTETLPMSEVDLSALGVPYASTPQPGMLCAGQISPEQLDALALAGFKNFISLRVAEERGAGWEEEHTAGRDLSFQRLPIAGADGISDENARALRAMLDATEGATVLYCGSSNRVGALLGLAAHSIDGKSKEEAREFARSAGMTGLEPVFDEVIGL